MRQFELKAYSRRQSESTFSMATPSAVFGPDKYHRKRKEKRQSKLTESISERPFGDQMILKSAANSPLRNGAVNGMAAQLQGLDSDTLSK